VGPDVVGPLVSDPKLGLAKLEDPVQAGGCGKLARPAEESQR
jgi:hypothetical protein